MSKLVVGQIVYLKPCGVRAKYTNEIRELEVKKVGRKYFFVGVIGENEEYSWIKFYVEDLKQVTDYGYSWSLYLSMQDIEDEKESLKLIEELRNIFGYYGNGRPSLTIEQLRKIKEIVG